HLRQEPDRLALLLLKRINRTSMIHPSTHDAIDVSAGHVGMDERSEARITRAVSQVRILANFHRHEVLCDDARILPRDFFGPFPIALGRIAQRILSVEFHAKKIIELGQKVERSRGHAHAPPRITQSLEYTALDEHEGPARSHHFDNPGTWEPTFPCASAAVERWKRHLAAQGHPAAHNIRDGHFAIGRLNDAKDGVRLEGRVAI